MAIMIFVAIGIAQAIWNTYKLRDQLAVEGDFYTAIRLTVSILERDLSQVFSAQMLLPDLKERLTPDDVLNLQTITRSDTERPSEYFTGIISKTGIRPSRFQGNKTRVSFLSASHRRIYKETAESIFSKIRYELQDEKGDANKGMKVLVKTEHSNAFDLEDDDRDENIKRYPLLGGITDLQFRFYYKDKDQWFDNWDSDRSESKNKFPDLVELKLQVQTGEKLKFSGVYHMRLEIPIDGITQSF